MHPSHASIPHRVFLTRSVAASACACAGAASAWPAPAPARRPAIGRPRGVPAAEDALPTGWRGKLALNRLTGGSSLLSGRCHPRAQARLS
ncbi:MAG: hypothetical protein JXQ71_12740 [Verrucomicrobia bacterium]|nr:hypothetical protein [Verrucomicrobiota bacterium]